MLIIIGFSRCNQNTVKETNDKLIEDVGDKPLELIDTLNFLDNPNQDLVVKRHLKILYSYLNKPLDSLQGYFDLKKSENNRWSEQIYTRELLPKYKEMLCLLSLSVPEPGKKNTWVMEEFRLSGIIKDGKLIVYRFGELRRKITGDSREFYIEPLFSNENGYLEFEKAFVGFYGLKPNPEELFDFSRRFGDCREGSDNAKMKYRLESKLQTDYLALLQSPNSELQLYGVSRYQHVPKSKWTNQEKKLIRFILNKNATVRTCEKLSNSSYTAGLESLDQLKGRFVFN